MASVTPGGDRRPTKPPCTVHDCPSPQEGRGPYCKKHAQRVRKHGDPHHVELIIRDDARRFWTKVDVGHPLGCWLWTGTADIYGYGLFTIRGKVIGAHRYAYQDLMGPIPRGLQLDHLCRNRPCVNPDHLEPVTPAENIRRSTSPTARLAARTHCINGHEFTPENTRVSGDGVRRCRACAREWNRRKRAARRAA